MSERSPGPAEPAEEPAPAKREPPSSPRHNPGASDTWTAPPLDKAEGEKRRGVLGFLRELPVLVILAFALAVLIKTFLFQAFYIPSGSMEPTLDPGDRVLVNKLAYRFGDIHRGDVIVFENPTPSEEPDRNPVSGFFVWLGRSLGISPPADEDFIKRVIALPGETVEIKDGQVFIDGEKIREPYLPKRQMGDFGPERIPDGELFVLGDNRNNSNDSRFALGNIPEDRIVGKAFVKIWPPSRIGWLRST